MMAAFAALSIGKKLAVFGVLIAAVAALILAVNAHDRSMKDAGRAEVRAEWDAEKRGAAEASAKFERDFGVKLGQINDNLSARNERITTQAAPIMLTVEKEIASAPRYSAPDCSLTPGVFDAVNAARGLSAATLAPAGGTDPMPASGNSE